MAHKQYGLYLVQNQDLVWNNSEMIISPHIGSEFEDLNFLYHFDANYRSDAAQPHYINIQFHKRTLVEVSIFC